MNKAVYKIYKQNKTLVTQTQHKSPFYLDYPFHRVISIVHCTCGLQMNNQLKTIK